MRYCDDIMIIVPDSAGINPKEIISHIVAQLKFYGGDHLEIKQSKTCMIQFKRDQNGALSYQHLKQFCNESNKNGLEYLGFCYDGKKIYIRDGAISNHYRKIANMVKKEAYFYAYKYPDWDEEQLLKKVNYSFLTQYFSKIDKENTTKKNFYSYAKRASLTFGDKGGRIMHQIRRSSKYMRKHIKEAIHKEVKKRGQLGLKIKFPN